MLFESLGSFPRLLKEADNCENRLYAGLLYTSFLGMSRPTTGAQMEAIEPHVLD